MISALFYILLAIAFFCLGIRWECYRTKRVLDMAIDFELQNIDKKGAYEGMKALKAFRECYYE